MQLLSSISKLAVSFISFGLTTTNAWDIDERCYARRRHLELQSDNDNLDLEAAPLELFVQQQQEEEYTNNSNSTRAYDFFFHHYNKTDHSNYLRARSSVRELQLHPRINHNNNQITHTMATTFHMKLNWFVGACWQEEWIEREWCMQCEGEECEDGDMLWLKRCSNIPQQRFQWIPQDNAHVANHINFNSGRLKLANYNLCLQRITSNTFRLRMCDYNANSQILIRSSSDGVFELYPKGNKFSKCLNQHHHPKPNETIIATFCSTARRWSTNNWEIYWPGNTAPGGMNGPHGNGETLFLRDEECSTDFPCGMCDGDCDRDSHCAGDLRCYQREGHEVVPGCRGEGNRGKDYCTQNVDNPGGDDETPDGENLFLHNFDCNEFSPCGRCEGDCDSNSDCQGSLTCFQRSSNEPVPGCGGHGIEGADYCLEYEYTGSLDELRLRDRKCSGNAPCEMCEGDCDKDKHCESGLVCFERYGNEEVPGCPNGIAQPKKDYCTVPPPSNHVRLRRPPCRPDNPCPKCFGDCNKDSDCEGNLKCFHRFRNRDTLVPGCIGMGGKGRDFCYDERDYLLH